MILFINRKAHIFFYNYFLIWFKKHIDCFHWDFYLILLRINLISCYSLQRTFSLLPNSYLDALLWLCEKYCWLHLYRSICYLQHILGWSQRYFSQSQSFDTVIFYIRVYHNEIPFFLLFESNSTFSSSFIDIRSQMYLYYYSVIYKLLSSLKLSWQS